jgi:dihydrodipicolinate reductase
VLDQFEVLIDFTRPEVTPDYLATCLPHAVIDPSALTAAKACAVE